MSIFRQKSNILYFSYLWNRNQYFIRRHIPGPPPSSYFSGNLRELQIDYQPFEKQLEWQQKYGKTFGIYEGSDRVIVTSDLSILHDVFQKKFENFHSRNVNYFIQIFCSNY